MKILNRNYRQFLDEGIINTINEDQVKAALANIGPRHIRQGRALLLALYFTGARPNEVLQLRGRDIEKEGQHVKVRLKASKGGLPRTMFLPSRNKLVMELYEYAQAYFMDMLLFWRFRDRYRRETITRSGKVKVRYEVTNKLRYYMGRWFDGVIPGGIPPYYLRHNRFSKLAEAGADLLDIRMLKGSRTMESVMPYLHMSSRSARKISRKID